MSSRLQALRIDSRWSWNSLWRWWRDGLLAWLPTSVRRWLAGSSRRLIIAMHDGQPVLLREEADQTQELERPDQSAPDWDTVAKRFGTEKSHQLVLRFPASRALVKTLSLPLAAAKNPRQVAGFEMDRLTPFPANQVYYGVTLLEHQPEQRRLRIELTVLPRADVDPVLAELQQRGLRPDALDVTGALPDLNLLPPEQRVRRGVWEKRLRTALILVVLSLVGAAAILPIWQQRLLLIGVIAKADRLQQAANQALTLRDQLDRTLETSRVLAEKKRVFPPRIDLLRELTTILPEDTWLERLQIKGDTVQINGQSTKASALVGIVESSNLFNSAGFMSPVTTDPRTSKERFVLGARIGREP